MWDVTKLQTFPLGSHKLSTQLLEDSTDFPHYYFHFSSRRNQF